jgi:hypothetical protein
MTAVSSLLVVAMRHDRKGLFRAPGVATSRRRKRCNRCTIGGETDRFIACD